MDNADRVTLRSVIRSLKMVLVVGDLTEAEREIIKESSERLVLITGGG